MEIDENFAPLNVVKLIRDIRQSALDTFQDSPKKCFPYVQTFYTPVCKDFHKFSYSNKFRNSFIHGETLKFKDKSFSLNRIFKNSEIKAQKLSSSGKRFKIKPFLAQKTFLQNFPLEYSPNSSNPPSQKYILNKINPRLRRPITKSAKIKPILINQSERLSPDLLTINKLKNRIQKPAVYKEKQAIPKLPMNKLSNRKLVIELESAMLLDESLKTFTRANTVLSPQQ